jgi:hypothetical protein
MHGLCVQSKMGIIVFCNCSIHWVVSLRIEFDIQVAWCSGWDGPAHLLSSRQYVEHNSISDFGGI